MSNYGKGYDDGYKVAEKIRSSVESRKFQLSRLKNKVLAVVTSAALASVAIGAYKLGQHNPVESEETSITVEAQTPSPLEGLEQTTKLSEVSPEVIVAWANYSYTNYVKNHPYDEEKIKDSYVAIKQAYDSYSDSLKDPLYGYVPTQLNHDPERDGELEQSTYSHSDAVAQTKQDLVKAAYNFEVDASANFSKSIFRYARVNEDNIVMVPCVKNISGVELPSNIEYEEVNGRTIMYIPYESTDVENINAMSK